MIDFARIAARAGDGGNGCGSFHQIKGKRYGRADGGDGGHGGNVYIEATGDLNTLEKYRYVRDYRAQNGGNGLSNHRRGADGSDLVLKVPVGTQLKVISLALNGNEARIVRGKAVTLENEKRQTLNETGLVTDQRLTTYDLLEDGQRVLVARGGEGGRGNIHLRDEYGRRPKAGEQGHAGEFTKITLELKLIADVGLIGLPNSGKSTLLAKLTAAKPKIADYPFTTLEPNLGVLNSLQLSVNNSQKDKTVNREPITVNQQAKLVIADIPGLIEGASVGRGLGDLFLRHIERTKVLVHLVDSSQSTVDPSASLGASGSQTGQNAATVNREPITVNSLWHNYQTVRAELKAYSGELAKKKEIIVLSKGDLVEAEVIEGAREEFRRHRKKVLVISAATGQGLSELARAIARATAL